MTSSRFEYVAKQASGRRKKNTHTKKKKRKKPAVNIDVLKQIHWKIIIKSMIVIYLFRGSKRYWQYKTIAFDESIIRKTIEIRVLIFSNFATNTV